MKTMKEYDHVRKLHFKDGLSFRQIAEKLKIARQTVKKMIELSAPPGYQRQKEPERPVLGPFISVIDTILESDRPPTPKKQRHTSFGGIPLAAAETTGDFQKHGLRLYGVLKSGVNGNELMYSLEEQ